MSASWRSEARRPNPPQGGPRELTRTTRKDTSRDRVGRSSRLFGLRVLACVVVALALRLPFVDDPLTSDEAGLLLVVRNFERGSVYGDYWVDRPPLVLGYYWLADRLAGETGVRLLGCVVAASLVVIAAVAGHLLHGRGGAIRAGLVAALLGSSYVIAGHLLNGMLQAATLSLLGMTLVVAAIESRRPEGLRFHGLLVAAGLASMSAALVKQSFVCGLAFGMAVLLAVRYQGRLTTPQTLAALSAGLGGALLGLSGVVAWAVRHGISVPDLWFSVVEFRLQAGDVLAATAMSTSVDRVHTLILAFLLSGLALFVWLFLAAAPSLLRNTRTRAYTFGVAASFTIAILSVVAGGSWWRHYLVQLVPAAVMTAALLAGREGRWSSPARTVLVVTTVCSMVGSVVGAYAEASPPKEVTVGRYVGAAAEPGDTALVTWGHPEVLLYADLGSTYPYLWSLPARTLDRDLSRLLRTVRGPLAPTWIVEWRSLRSWDGRGGARLARAVQQRYRLLGRPCGEPVYLLRGVERTLPKAACAEGSTPTLWPLSVARSTRAWLSHVGRETTAPDTGRTVPQAPFGFRDALMLRRAVGGSSVAQQFVDDDVLASSGVNGPGGESYSSCLATGNMCSTNSDSTGVELIPVHQPQRPQDTVLRCAT